MPGDFFGEVRTVGANVFLGTAALGHGRAEIPELVAPDGALDEAAARVKGFGHLTELRPFRQFGVHGLDG